MPSCKTGQVDCNKLGKEIKDFVENVVYYRMMILRCDKWPPPAPKPPKIGPAERGWDPLPAGHGRALCDAAKRVINCEAKCPNIKHDKRIDWILLQCKKNNGVYPV
jgi:hypothetical protein